MTTKAPSKKAVSANRAAFDSTTKKPHIQWVDIVNDDELAETYEEALAALNTREQALQASAPRRLAAARNAMSATISPEDEARELAAVTTADDLILDDLRAALEDAQAALHAATTRYKFRALGRAAWEELKSRHEPTDEDHANAQEATGKEDARADYHMESLAPELVQIACVSPRLTAEQVDEIFNGDTWNDAEIALLFQTALIAQVTSRKNPVGRG